MAFVKRTVQLFSSNGRQLNGSQLSRVSFSLQDPVDVDDEDTYVALLAATFPPWCNLIVPTAAIVANGGTTNGLLWFKAYSSPTTEFDGWNRPLAVGDTFPTMLTASGSPAVGTLLSVPWPRRIFTSSDAVVAALQRSINANTYIRESGSYGWLQVTLDSEGYIHWLFTTFGTPPYVPYLKIFFHAPAVYPGATPSLFGFKSEDDFLFLATTVEQIGSSRVSAVVPDTVNIGVDFLHNNDQVQLTLGDQEPNMLGLVGTVQADPSAYQRGENTNQEFGSQTIQYAVPRGLISAIVVTIGGAEKAFTYMDFLGHDWQITLGFGRRSDQRTAGAGAAAVVAFGDGSGTDMAALGRSLGAPGDRRESRARLLSLLSAAGTVTPASKRARLLAAVGRLPNPDPPQTATALADLRQLVARRAGDAAALASTASVMPENT